MASGHRSLWPRTKQMSTPALSGARPWPSEHGRVVENLAQTCAKKLAIAENCYVDS